MSYVTIFKIEANGDVEDYAEGSNNHVFAPLVWSVLGSKYGFLTDGGYALRDPGLNKLWNAWPDKQMSRLEQVLLGATFDRVWFRREILPEVIEACEWFLHEHILKPHKGKDWKTGAVVDQFYDSRALAGDPDEMFDFEGKKQKVLSPRTGIIKALKEILADPTTRGAAFNCCSAVGAFWYVRDVPISPSTSEDGTIQHSKDEDCAGHIEERECTLCGVWHDEKACEECGATAFHKETCSDYEWDSRPWNIDKDKTQKNGEYPGKSAWELSEGLAQPEISLP